jgi:clan AA aspartic protease (TIGR02281 family)
MSERAALVHANEICAKYQKAAVVDNERYGVVLPGGSIDEISFSCRVSRFNGAPPPEEQRQQTADAAVPATSQYTPLGRASQYAAPEKAVSLQKRGGTFVVPVTINNTLQLPFTIDSGASDVSIPADVVLTLIRAGTIGNTDFLGKQTYTLADGSVLPSLTFRIRSLRVGDQVLENVTGSVAPSSGALLLGQSFLSRFRSWSIDNRRMVLVLE